MNSLTRDTIILKGAHIGKQEEATAAEVVYPGQFVELTAEGKLVKAAGNSTVKRIVVENTFIGEGIESPYAVNDVVRYVVVGSGDVVNARVAAATAAFTVGAPVSVAATGFVNPTEDNVIGDVREPLDNSSGTEAAFLVTTIA